jgi:hypothetical protein
MQKKKKKKKSFSSSEEESIQRIWEKCIPKHQIYMKWERPQDTFSVGLERIAHP